LKRLLPALVSALLLISGSLAPANAAVGTFTWESPASGSTQSGQVTIKAKVTPTSPAAGDQISSWCIMLDGSHPTTNPVGSSSLYNGVAASNKLAYFGSWNPVTGCWDAVSSNQSLTTGALVFDTTTWSNGSHPIIMTYSDFSGLSRTSSTFNLVTSNAGPSFSWESPASGSSVSGVVVIKARAVASGSGTATISKWCLLKDGAIVSQDPAAGESAYDGTYWSNDLVGYTYGSYSGASIYNSTTGCWSGSALTTGAIKFDTTTWSNATYNFQIVATDTSNRQVTSSTLSLSTSNAGPSFSWESPASGSSVSGVVVIKARAVASESGTATISKWCLLKDGAIVSQDPAASESAYDGTYWSNDLVGYTYGSYSGASIYNSTTGCWSGSALTTGAIQFDTGFLSSDSIKFRTSISSSINLVVYDSSNRQVTSNPLLFTAQAGRVTVSVFPKPGVPGYAPAITSGLRTVSSFALSIAESSDASQEILGYKINFSVDGGKTWQDSATSISTYTFQNVPGASTYLVQAAAVNSRGQGPWGPVSALTTKGARSNRVVVRDSLGQPVSGGQITWTMVSEQTHSSRIYGLTSDGVIDFPSTPAGLVDIEITNGELVDGTLVSGRTRQLLGLPITEVSLPAKPKSSWDIFVHLPDSIIGVANVDITLNPYSQSDWMLGCTSVGGFTFVLEQADACGDGAPTSGRARTNQLGYATLFGFAKNSNSTFTANYDDGVINQSKSGMISTSTADIELDYVPWFSFANSSLSGSIGSAVPVVINLNDAGSTPAMLRPAAVGFGESVRLIPPVGAKTGACGKKGAVAKLTGQANSQGKVNLKVCASVSGIYKIQSTGAAATGSVQVLVSGAPPLPVNSVTVGSRSPGSVTASWNAPTFTGGAPILDYKVVITNNGKTYTKTVKSSAKAITLGGLKNASDCTVKIQARTKYGYSVAYADTVPIA
jgi:hypothetical protein